MLKDENQKVTGSSSLESCDEWNCLVEKETTRIGDLHLWGGLGEGVASLIARVLGDGNAAEGGGGNPSTSVVSVPELVTGDASDRSIIQSAISGVKGREVCV